jgi:hypothetical protein
LKNGWGIFRWPDGRKYDGHWKDGVQHGSGTFTSSSGRVKAVEFEHGVHMRAHSNALSNADGFASL